MESTLSARGASGPQPRQVLSLIDAASIMVGIIIGSAIFEIAPQAASGSAGPALALAGRYFPQWISSGGSAEALGVAAVVGIWLLGALIALVGAMCYAELATAFPVVGGTYVYLSEGLGRTCGFAFAWAEFWIVRPGNIGAVAYVMAKYALPLLPAAWSKTPYSSVVLATGAIVVLAIVNALGVRAGKGIQNLLTGAKLLGLAAIVVIGLTTQVPEQLPLEPLVVNSSLTLALIQIMFAYGGWADMSFVAAEVRNPERNIFRALLLGTATVATIYVLTNLGFLHALGLRGVVDSIDKRAVAVEVVSLRLGDLGTRAISTLVAVSCLGAINGMLLTGARVFYALGTHHPTFRWLGAWNERTGVPLRSLALQVLVTIGLVIACGGNQGFQRLVVFTAPFYWGFIALVGVALVVLRWRGRTAVAAYQVPLFPLTMLVFIGSSGAMVLAGIDYALSNRAIEALWAVAVVVSAMVVGAWDWWARTSQQSTHA